MPPTLAIYKTLRLIPEETKSTCIKSIRRETIPKPVCKLHTNLMTTSEAAANNIVSQYPSNRPLNHNRYQFSATARGMTTNRATSFATEATFPNDSSRRLPSVYVRRDSRKSERFAKHVRTWSWTFLNSVRRSTLQGFRLEVGGKCEEKLKIHRVCWSNFPTANEDAKRVDVVFTETERFVETDCFNR